MCLVVEEIGMNTVRSVPSLGEILSLEEKGTLGVSVCQKGDKLPKNIVVNTIAQEYYGNTVERSTRSACRREKSIKEEEILDLDL